MIKYGVKCRAAQSREIHLLSTSRAFVVKIDTLSHTLHIRTSHTGATLPIPTPAHINLKIPPIKNMEEALLAAALRYTPTGKSVVITGGTKGIGRAIIEELGPLRARLLTCARNAADLAALLEECAAKGWDVKGIGEWRARNPSTSRGLLLPKPPF